MLLDTQDQHELSIGRFTKKKHVKGNKISGQLGTSHSLQERVIK